MQSEFKCAVNNNLQVLCLFIQQLIAFRYQLVLMHNWCVVSREQKDSRCKAHRRAAVLEDTACWRGASPGHHSLLQSHQLPSFGSTCWMTSQNPAEEMKPKQNRLSNSGLDPSQLSQMRNQSAHGSTLYPLRDAWPVYYHIWDRAIME